MTELVRKWCTVAITATQTPFGGTITLVVSMDAARERKRVQCILASQRASSLSLLTFSLFFSPFSCTLLSLLPQRSLPLSLSCSTAKRPTRRCIPRFGNPGSRMTLLSDRLISMSWRKRFDRTTHVKIVETRAEPRGREYLLVTVLLGHPIVARGFQA